MTTPYDTLDTWIDAHFDEEVRFLQALVRVPTDTPPGNNAPHAQRTAELLAGMGYTAEAHPVPEAEVRAYGLQSITNLIVRRPYGTPGSGPVVALNAHGDVVPPGDGWARDPYGADIEDGKLYGRAAAVSKSDFASFTFAVRALESLGLPVFRMPSGAGHDAMKLHEVMPQAMLFMRGLNSGISHNPLESITNHDTELVVQAFLHLLDGLAA